MPLVRRQGYSPRGGGRERRAGARGSGRTAGGRGRSPGSPRGLERRLAHGERVVLVNAAVGCRRHVGKRGEGGTPHGSDPGAQHRLLHAEGSPVLDGREFVAEHAEGPDHLALRREERVEERLRGSEARRRGDGEEASDDVDCLGRDLGPRRVGEREAPVQDPVDHPRDVGPLVRGEGGGGGKHRVGHASGGPEVNGARVLGAVWHAGRAPVARYRQHLGRRELGGADEGLEDVGVDVGALLRHAKVGEEDPVEVGRGRVLGHHQDVLRLDIPMHKVVCVEVVEGFHQLTDHIGSIGVPHRPVGKQPVQQVPAGRQGGHDVHRFIVLEVSDN
mmetsp:Transcript_2404/g.6091  ORF Transcript_2404/g.6091 Transcript_2404/m.6091 type:complete len:332 (-) Transcript_2404:358-1353(-)